jgi:hypothetical protein
LKKNYKKNQKRIEKMKEGGREERGKRKRVSESLMYLRVEGTIRSEEEYGRIDELYSKTR